MPEAANSRKQSPISTTVPSAVGEKIGRRTVAERELIGVYIRLGPSDCNIITIIIIANIENKRFGFWPPSYPRADARQPRISGHREFSLKRGDILLGDELERDQQLLLDRLAAQNSVRNHHGLRALGDCILKHGRGESSGGNGFQTGPQSVDPDEHLEFSQAVCGLDGQRGADRHLVVLRDQGLKLSFSVLPQEALHDGLAIGTRRMPLQLGDNPELRIIFEHRFEAGFTARGGGHAILENKVDDVPACG